MPEPETVPEDEPEVEPESEAEPEEALPGGENRDETPEDDNNTEEREDIPELEEVLPEAQPLPEEPSAEAPAAEERVIGPEDTLGTEDEINSLLDEIDAEKIPEPPRPSQPEPEPEPQLQPKPQIQPNPEFKPEPEKNAPPEPPAPELPAPKPRASKPEERVQLLDYLMSLTASLPESKRADFTHGDVPLKIEAVKNMLRGKQGLHRDFPDRRKPPEPITQDRVKKSFSFVSGLADHLPNQDIKTILKEKLNAIARRLSEKPEDKAP
jgi:hypothetical protein